MCLEASDQVLQFVDCNPVRCCLHRDGPLIFSSACNCYTPFEHQWPRTSLNGLHAFPKLHTSSIAGPTRNVQRTAPPVLVDTVLQTPASLSSSGCSSFRFRGGGTGKLCLYPDTTCETNNRMSSSIGTTSCVTVNWPKSFKVVPINIQC